MSSLPDANLSRLRWAQLVISSPLDEQDLQRVLNAYLDQFRTLPSEHVEDAKRQIIDLVLLQCALRPTASKD